MASVDVPVALLGYGTVGAAVNRLLHRAGGRHRARDRPPAARRQGARPQRRQAARVPARRRRAHDRHRRGARRPVDRDRGRGHGRRRPDGRVRARGCCGAASTSSPRTSSSSRGAGPSSSRPRRARGVQLRFEASVCAAIPVIKVLRESLVVTNVHRVLGIVNGTTNYMLTEMEAGKSYDGGARRRAGEGLRRGRPDRRRDRRRRRGQDGDPRHGRVQLALRAGRRRGRSASTASTRSTSPPRASSRW